MVHDGSIRFLPGAAGERALVSRLVAGEEPAFRECYEQYAPALMRLLLRMLRNRPLAEEVLQDTFVAAFNGIHRFRGEARLSSWLARIAVRRALNAARGEGRRAKNLPETKDVEPSFSTEAQLLDADLTRKVFALIDALEEPKRLVMLLHAEGYTAAEIADTLDCPRGTVLARISRARAELLQRAEGAGLTLTLRDTEVKA